MDSTDENILNLLKGDSKMTATDIGSKVGLSESTVRQRIKRMQDSKVIKKFTIETTYDEDATNAIVLVSVVSATDSSSVSKELAELDGVKMVYEITGQYDIATIIGASSVMGINATIDELRKVPDVMDTNTMIILRKVS